MGPRRARSLTAALLGGAVAWRSATACAQAAADGGTTAAARDTLAFEWTAPPGCPSRDAVRAAIVRAVAQAPTTGDAAAAIDARATVAQGPRGWTLSLQTLRAGAHGERVMQADSCAALADAATLIVALMINPNALPAPLEPAPDAAPPAPIVVAPPSVARVAPPVALVAPSPVASVVAPAPLPRRVQPRPVAPRAMPLVAHVRLGLDALADVGSLAAPAWGLGLRGGVALGAFSAWLAAALYPSQHGVDAAAPASGGDFVLTHGALWACYARRFGPVEPALCAGLELGAIHAAGTGVAHPASRWVLESAQVDQVSATVWLARAFGLHFAAGIALPFAPERFVIDGLGSVYAQSPVAARGSAGVELSF